MDKATGQSVLRRMAGAGRNRAPDARAVLPARALSSALAKAASSVVSIAVRVTSCSERIASLSDLLETLPERGLLALLEGPEDGQGIAVFDFGLLSAVVEMQMTGALSPGTPPPRRVTRTDAALAADLIDAVLIGFETALLGREESRWASDFGYASHVEDLRPLGLMLEDVDYRIFGLSVDIESGGRKGQFVLALPARGRGPIRMPPDAGEGTAAEDPDEGLWRRALEDSVRDGDVRLDAVLHRIRLPISTIANLRPGDELPIPFAAIDRVQLTAGGLQGFGRWRLGQSHGHKALRLGQDGGALQGNLPRDDRVGHGCAAEASRDAVPLRDITPGGAEDAQIAPAARAAKSTTPVSQGGGPAPNAGSDGAGAIPDAQATTAASPGNAPEEGAGALEGDR
ncbi:FliM/FliN family flagellar motor switch protein [Tropicimonas sp. IMCC34043]|uniref:FliM/FliN family flagellar motor switch protein n=1 Tax=Tropicimonas sp. IMCC34043 TaxID=2248760 RepID=UPI001300B824|nr:FliM/FliN family flagellar motor switch protein [Tropicimonas sp. IMCC34043]